MRLKKRVTVFISIISICLVLLIARLAQLQLISTESFTDNHINLYEASVSQRTQSWTLDQGRGRFIDTNGEALTHDYYPTLILFPFLKEMDWPAEEIAKIVNIEPQRLTFAVEQATKPFVFGEKEPIKLSEHEMNEINKLKSPGVFALHQQVEINSSIAEHLIGITRENGELIKRRYKEKLEQGLIDTKTKIGITGLQQSFDEFLLPEGEAKLLYHVDQRGGPLFGLDVRYTAPANPFYPTAIKTTIDKELQAEAEKILDKVKFSKGGIVLIDIESNSIAALVSRPYMNQHNPFGDAGGINHIIVPQIPGSIFKIVTAAAAIEKNAPIRGRTFDCDFNLYGEEDESTRQLGKLSFEESFAQSCNYTFASLAQEMIVDNNKVLEQYAHKLGLLDPVGWQGDVFHFQNFIQIPGEHQGTLWSNDRDKSVSKAIAQTAIGQKQVRISPLAIANMMATIARGGEKREVLAVSEVQYKNGTTLFTFPNQLLEGPELSSYTASHLQKLLRRVVSEGTGSSFSSLPLTVAGKSGTAETGLNNKVNKWFAGYFPADSPKYALAVVELDVREGQAKTYEVFSQLVKAVNRTTR